MDWKAVVDCPVQPDRVGFMTDRDVGELVSEDLFPVVLTDFTPHTRRRVRPLCGSSLANSDELAWTQKTAEVRARHLHR